MIIVIIVIALIIFFIAGSMLEEKPKTKRKPLLTTKDLILSIKSEADFNKVSRKLDSLYNRVNVPELETAIYEKALDFCQVYDTEQYEKGFWDKERNEDLKYHYEQIQVL